MVRHGGGVGSWIAVAVSGAAVVGLSLVAALSDAGTTERVLAVAGAAAAVISAAAALYPVVMTRPGGGHPVGVKGHRNQVVSGTGIAVGTNAVVRTAGPSGTAAAEVQVEGDDNSVATGDGIAVGDGARANRHG